MIRLKLNSSKGGVLYHFTGSMRDVDAIVTEGLRTSNTKEPHMQNIPDDDGIKNRTSKRLADKEHSAYVSFARSPSIITQLNFGWNFGVIFDAEKISALGRVRPYHYSTSNHTFSLEVSRLDDGGIGFKTDASRLIRIPAKKGSYEEDTPWYEFMDNLEELDAEMRRWSARNQGRRPPLSIELGTDSVEISGKLTPRYDFSSLPAYFQKMLSAAGFESEDRLLVPEKSEEALLAATRNAVIGIIVPDWQYWSSDVESFRRKHPNIPVYAYRQNKRKPTSEKPIPKEAYRLPTA